MDHIISLLDDLGWQWKKGFWARNLFDLKTNHLDDACRTFIGWPDSRFNESGLTAPDRVWSFLNESATRDDLRSLCEPGCEFAGDAPERLFTNARRSFAAGVACRFIAHPDAKADLDALERWLARYADPDGPDDRFAGQLGPFAREDLLGCMVQRLSPESRFNFELLVRHFIRGHRRDKGPLVLPDDYLAPGDAVEVRFPTYDDCQPHRPGSIYALSLTRYDTGPAGLYQSPSNYHLSLGTDWVQVLDRAHHKFCERFPGAVVWGVRRLFAAGEQRVRSVGGQSHTLAAAVGFRALCEGTRVDAGCLMSAWFGEGPAAWGEPNPPLEKVKGEREKAEGACRYGHTERLRLLIATNSEFGAGRSTYESTQGRAGGTVDLVPHADFDSAYHDATGLTTGLVAYLRHAAGLLDAATPAYFGKERRLSAVYVEPEMFRDDVTVEREGSGGGGPIRQRPPADQTEELLRYYAEPRDGPKRSRWRKEWPKLRTAAVVIGYPGDGKSVLALKLVKDIAERALAELLAGKVSTDRVTVPIFIRLQTLGETGTLETALAAGLLDTPEPVLHYLREALLTERAWVILDGLDEVKDDPEHRGAVKKQLELLTSADARCRVVFTSRPYAYHNSPLLPRFPRLAEYKLAPFTDRQQQQFVRNWFSSESKRTAAVTALGRGNTSVAEMMRNGLLLSLICAASEPKPLDPGTTRPQVYEKIVEMLYCGVWKGGAEEIEDLDTQISVLQHVAWTLFRDNPAGWSFHGKKEWVPAVTKARSGQLEMRTARFKSGLRTCGLVVPTGNGTEAFLHRTFLEYLAAAHVALMSEPHRTKAVNRFLWTRGNSQQNWQWEPAAEEFLTFVAGCMKDPTPLLRRIHAEGERLPDALFVMIRLAGRCLKDVHPDKVDSPFLSEILDNAETAYAALGRSDGAARALAHPVGVQRLEAVLRREGDVNRSLNLISQMGPVAASSTVVAGLLTALHDGADGVRRAAAGALRALGVADPTVVNGLLAALHDGDWVVRCVAAGALGALGVADPTVVDGLLAALRDAPRDGDADVRCLAAGALGELGVADPAVVAGLLTALHDGDADVRCVAAGALGELGVADPTVAWLLTALRDKERSVRLTAAGALNKLLSHRWHVRRDTPA